MQLYRARKKVLKSANEEQHWNEINWEFMTEESEDDEETIAKHPLTFRSEGK